jgi:hypothetical protein
MINELIHNQQIVQALWDTVNTSSGSLVNVAPLIKRVLKKGAWKERQVDQLGEVVRFDSFREFIEAAPLKGCGWTRELVEPLIRDDAETLAMWREAWTAPAHRPPAGSTDNVSTSPKPKHGNSRAYTLSRLKRVRPDLFEKVCAKEMSANAAAIEAGIRKKPERKATPTTATTSDQDTGVTDDEQLSYLKHTAHRRRLSRDNRWPTPEDVLDSGMIDSGGDPQMIEFSQEVKQQLKRVWSRLSDEERGLLARWRKHHKLDEPSADADASATKISKKERKQRLQALDDAARAARANEDDELDVPEDFKNFEPAYLLRIDQTMQMSRDAEYIGKMMIGKQLGQYSPEQLIEMARKVSAAWSSVADNLAAEIAADRAEAA